MSVLSNEVIDNTEMYLKAMTECTNEINLSKMWIDARYYVEQFKLKSNEYSLKDRLHYHVKEKLITEIDDRYLYMKRKLRE